MKTEDDWIICDGRSYPYDQKLDNLLHLNIGKLVDANTYIAPDLRNVTFLKEYLQHDNSTIISLLTSNTNQCLPQTYDINKPLEGHFHDVTNTNLRQTYVMKPQTVFSKIRNFYYTIQSLCE